MEATLAAYRGSIPRLPSVWGQTTELSSVGQSNYSLTLERQALLNSGLTGYREHPNPWHVRAINRGATRVPCQTKAMSIVHLMPYPRIRSTKYNETIPIYNIMKGAYIQVDAT
jgi:hypothetical protein